jgi:hypothetical protein
VYGKRKDKVKEKYVNMVEMDKFAYMFGGFEDEDGI